VVEPMVTSEHITDLDGAGAVAAVNQSQTVCATHTHVVCLHSRHHLTRTPAVRGVEPSSNKL